MGVTGIHIRKVKTGDIEVLRAISLETFYDAFIGQNSEANMQAYMKQYFTKEILLRELEEPESAFYFAELNGQQAGYLKLNTGKAQTELREPGGLEIERIYVLKAFQGNQIGQRLFDKAVQVAATQQKDYVWLGVWEKNTRAIRFYERNGMHVFSSHPFQLGDELQTDIMMKRQLGK